MQTVLTKSKVPLALHHRSSLTTHQYRRSFTVDYTTNASTPPLDSSSAVSATAIALVDASKAAPNWDPRSAVVYPFVLSEAQESQLYAILARKFQRRRYERNHWDAAIQGFKEVELFDENVDLKAILHPIRTMIEQNHSSPNLASSQVFSGAWLPCHSIDLHETGVLNAHVDSVRFSGNIVAGLSLQSDSILRLRPVAERPDTEADNPRDVHTCIDLMLPTRSLYVLSGQSRYDYTHELLPSGSLFRGTTCVNRGPRMSVIFRDAKCTTGISE